MWLVSESFGLTITSDIIASYESSYPNVDAALVELIKALHSLATWFNNWPAQILCALLTAGNITFLYSLFHFKQ